MILLFISAALILLAAAAIEQIMGHNGVVTKLLPVAVVGSMGVIMGLLLGGAI